MDVNLDSFDEESDISSSSSSSSASSSPTSSPNGRSSSDLFKNGEDDCSGENSDGIINRSQLLEFLKRVDPKASLDDDSTLMVTEIADAFINDVCDRVVQLGKYRQAEPNCKDLEFILKREYNMQFPKISINPQQKQKN